MFSLFHLIKTKLNFSISGFLFSPNLRISVQDIEMMTSFTSFLEPLGKAESPYISLLVFVCPILSLFTGKVLNWSLWNLIIFIVLLTQKQTNQIWSEFPDFARRGTDIVFWF